MRPFSFIHAADLHLGYEQYGLEARRRDFDDAFGHLVDRTLELRPDFMIIAGDLFHQPRPSNATLEKAIRNFGRLRQAGIPVLTVDGSHDSAPNTITGTVLHPLDSAGLIFHLPRHDGACWQLPERCYVYGIPNFRTKHKTVESLPFFLNTNPPRPEHGVFNICVFHMAVDLKGVKPPYIEAEVSPELLPDCFNYYAAGHVHERYEDNFKTGRLVYSGCIENTDYLEAKLRKGFYHVQVDSNCRAHLDFVDLPPIRPFKVFDEQFEGIPPSKIAERMTQALKNSDEEGAVLVPVLRGTLPAGANRSDVDIAGLRVAAEKALTVHPVVLLRESDVSEETVRSIFEADLKDLNTKAFEYFMQILSERQSPEKIEKTARAAVNLVEPLVKKDDFQVKQIIEDLLA